MGEIVALIATTNWQQIFFFGDIKTRHGNVFLTFSARDLVDLQQIRKCHIVSDKLDFKIITHR